MADDRVQSGTPAADIPELAGDLRGPEPYAAPATLGFDLVGVVDSVRGIAAELGLRPYRVFLVHAVWTGSQVGEGLARVTSRREILPPPRVRDIDSVNRNVHSTGLTEEGDVVIDQISARIPEDDLTGRTPDLRDPLLPRTSKRNVEFFWEIRELRPSTPPPPARRFSPPSKVPVLSRDGMSWRVTLTKQDYDAGRYEDCAP